MDRSHPATTPFPNVLLDDLLPRLSDTEWRVLCVVVRATWGWQDDEGKRKYRDWLTHSQLCARTGRASAAVSQAIQGLLNKKLLVVEDDAGNPLSTPALRRAARSRLYFRVAASLCISVSESEIITSQTVAERPPVTSETEIRKAKMTKENENKTPPSQTSTFLMDDNEESSSEQVAAAEILALLDHYAEQFQKHSPRRLPPPLTWSREGMILRHLLKQYAPNTLRELIDAFFLIDDKWVKEQGYSLIAFRYRIPQLLMRPRNSAVRSPDPVPHTRKEAAPQEVNPPSAHAWHFDADKKQFVSVSVENSE